MLTRNYPDTDMACHGQWQENIYNYGHACGCGGYLPEFTPELLAILDEISDECQKIYNVKPGVDCAYRCDVHNLDVGGKPGINHNAIPTYAVDLSAEGIGVDNLAAIAERLQADGVGRYYDDNFVHVDTRSGRVGGNFRW